LGWGKEDSLALAALASPRDQIAKQVFVADLERTYKTIEALNTAWGTTHVSWDTLLDSRETPDAVKAREDLVAFYTKTAETYFRVISEEGRASLFLFDCLSELAPDWNSDRMLGNFFMLLSPYIQKAGAVAYFALFRNQHSFHAMTPILDNSPVFLFL